MTIVDLNVFVLVYYVIVNWGWNKAVRQLEAIYKAQNFKVNLIYKTLWIFQDKTLVSGILSKSAGSELTYAYHNFFASHPFKFGIGNFNVSIEMWNILHESLAQSLMDGSRNGSIEQIMEKHKKILLNNEGNMFQIGGNGDMLEKYLTTVWAEFCFGQNITEIEYTQMRKLLLKTIRSSFYNHNDSFVPFIGYLMCKIRSIWYSKEYNVLKEKIQKLLDKIPRNVEGQNYDNYRRCFFSILKSKLEERIGPDSFDTEGKTMIDNVFLSVLALDFIHVFFTQVIFSLTQSTQIEIYDAINQSKIFKESLVKGFLFPWRSRKIGNDFRIEGNSLDIAKGDIAMINLVSSEYFFSTGQRSCIAPGFVKKCYNKLLDILSPFQLSRVDDNEILYDKNENTPFVHSHHYIRLVLSRQCLKSCEGIPNKFGLNVTKHKGVDFYHVHELVNNVTLSDWIANEICRKVKNFSRKHDITFDGVISAEARGWLFASVPANKLGLPLYIARKGGKLPGLVICKKYQKDGYKTDGTEELEIPLNVKNMSLVVIDDGIASGKTTEALYDLVKSNDNSCMLIISIIKHTYVECKFEPSPNETKILTLFDL